MDEESIDARRALARAKAAEFEEGPSAEAASAGTGGSASHGSPNG